MINVTFNGSVFQIPQENDEGWADSLTSFFVSVANNALSKIGGNFDLASELNFGNAYGIKVLYISSNTANASTAGEVRLARSDSIAWRNEANSANLELEVNSSDKLLFATKYVITQAGGSIPLDANLNLGSTYQIAIGSLKASYLEVPTGAASSGVVRLANADSVAWLNAAGNADLALSVGSDDKLKFGGVPVIVNPMTAQGDLIIGGASGVYQRLAGSTTGPERKVLVQDAPTGGVAALPKWDLDLADVTKYGRVRGSEVPAVDPAFPPTVEDFLGWYQEVKMGASAYTLGSIGTTLLYGDVTGMSVSLTPGRYRITYNVFVNLYGSNLVGGLVIRTAANAIVPGSRWYDYGISLGKQIQAYKTCIVTPTVTTTYKLSARGKLASGSGGSVSVVGNTASTVMEGSNNDGDFGMLIERM